MSLISRALSHINKSLVVYKQISEKIKTDKRYTIVNYDADIDKIIFYIQINPTRSILKLEPKELINNDDMLDGFCSTDIRTIAFFAYRELSKKINYRYSIKSIKLIEDKYYIEYSCQTGKIYTAPIEEVSKDKVIIEKFSPIEAHMMGYVSCENSILKEAVLKKYAQEI